MPPSSLLRMFSGSIIAVLLGLSPAKAEMLQFSAPDGSVKSWPKLPDISDWHQDQEQSVKRTANFLVPDGADPTNAPVTIQARGFARSGDTSSLSQLMDKDRAAAPPTAQVSAQADLYDKDGTPFKLVSFAPAPGSAGTWKATAYSEEGDFLLAFTLEARSQAAYDQNLPVFTGLVRKYAKDIPW